MLARHTYSPASAGEIWKMYRREPRTWAVEGSGVSAGLSGAKQRSPVALSQQSPAPKPRIQNPQHQLYSVPSHLPGEVYLVPGREAAPTLVPCDWGVGLPCHHTAQIKSLSLSHRGGGGLNPDGWDRSWGCGNRGPGRRCSPGESRNCLTWAPRPGPGLGVFGGLGLRPSVQRP